MNEIIISEQLKDKPISKFIEAEILKCEESLKDLELDEIQTLKLEKKQLKEELDTLFSRFYGLEDICASLQKRIYTLEDAIAVAIGDIKPSFNECDSLSCIAITVDQNLMARLTDENQVETRDWESVGLTYLEDMGNLRKEHPELFEDDPIDPYTGNKL